MNFTQGHRDYRQPPDRKSMHARIVRDLGMRIVAGEFKPGDRLPGEAALLADYGVTHLFQRRTKLSPDTPRGNFMRLQPGSVRPLHSGVARGEDV